MKQIVFWSIRELKNQKRWSLFFILNLAVGLSGFIALDAFKAALQKSFRDNAKMNMAGDLSIGIRRQFSADEVKKVNSLIEKISTEKKISIESSRSWELFSMALVQKGSAQDSRLVQVVAVDSRFPFYGELKIEKTGVVAAGQASELTQSKVAWVYPEILLQLGIGPSDFIDIGGESFQVVGIIREDPTQGLRFSSLSPKVYVGISQIQKTRLISYGTTMSDEILFKFSDEAQIEKVKKELEAAFPDPAVRVITYNENAEESGAALKYLSDYLGLVALVALFLAGLGSVFLFRSFLLSKYYSIAIQNSLGLPLNRAVQIYIVQLLILGFGASVVSLAGAQVILPFLSRLLDEFTPISLGTTLPASTVMIAFIMGIFGSVILGYPFLRPIYRIRSQELLQESKEFQPRSSRRDLIWQFPIWLLFWVLSILQSNSFRTGSLFFFVFLLSLGALWASGFLILKYLNPHKIFALDFLSIRWPLRQALISIQRRVRSKVAVVVAIGLGSILINLLPQLEIGLRENISSPETSKVPSLFMFDIQQEQIEPLIHDIKNLGYELSNISPLVRARVTKINDQDYERSDLSKAKTREEEREARFRNRGVNLSYREVLTDAESIVEGHPFPGRYQAETGVLPQISVEERFADTMNIHMQDILTFDIQGIEVKGQVTSFRKVQWNSFQPNFFIQFQAGVLEDAPQTLLASISRLQKDQVGFIQSQLSRNFPNVSMIDVGRMIDKIIDVSKKMSWSLEVMAYLSILAGFVILYSLASVEVRQRSWDLNMMKIFGSEPSDLYTFLLMEFGLVVCLGAFLGTALSFLVSYSISVYLFEGIFKADWMIPLRNLLTILGLSIVIVYLSARRVILKPSKEIFLS